MRMRCDCPTRQKSFRRVRGRCTGRHQQWRDGLRRRFASGTDRDVFWEHDFKDRASSERKAIHIADAATDVSGAVARYRVEGGRFLAPLLREEIAIGVILIRRTGSAVYRPANRIAQNFRRSSRDRH